ncbi:SGNH/GDSL hydrolase family protein [Domibacillus sp. DTU_2020_1001157_1_SI_ALB_TIR_016]|uniref:SGNH/GDSL hydrolase family protein n=1 Tax=Domibacillus sp. DTU_2020_1001157_1_SI_ALB_TIR_016 TaxID=3077789 RepID=UPI0028E714D9|nr:SGNH/GDSL hydrolase family protein [Domibacillus sp. DTU_2020_1001157_1_SI_ALB_TIR_016]WNS81192.1 SGNH/GDSL hydrolase family protein [Domibacillus sp. DTU_2020_1001157_1_SI_ALB_TIR_016]
MPKNFLFILAIVSTISILFAGKLHYDEKIKAQGQTAYETFKQKEDRQALLDSLNPERNPDQSLVDYLYYKSLTQEQVRISLFGSSGTAGIGASGPNYALGSRLEAEIQALGNDFQHVHVHIHGFPEYSTARLVKEAKVKSVIRDKPDLVIFETALFHNYDQHVPMDETKKDIEAIVQSIQQHVPEAKILLTSSNPVSLVSEERTQNNIGYTYNDYIRAITQLTKEKSWVYANIHNDMEARLAAENTKLPTILIEGTYPNDEGYLLWAEKLVEYMAQ